MPKKKIGIKILDFLIENEGRFVSREEVIKEIWGPKALINKYAFNTLRVHLMLTKYEANLRGYELLIAKGSSKKGYLLIKLNQK